MVYEHRIEVLVDGPVGRFGNDRSAVSIFDNMMGRSEDWARRTKGTSTPSMAYVRHLNSTATRMLFDESLPQTLTAGLAVFDYESRGYFRLDLRPKPGVEEMALLPFTPWGGYVPERGDVQPLPVRIRAEENSNGWLIHVKVDLPSSG